MVEDHLSTQEEAEDIQEPEGPPQHFSRHVKQALEHMLDLRYLQYHPLVERLGLTLGRSTAIAGQRLRQELAAAIETLLPGRRVSFRSPQARIYHLIRLHYMQGKTVDEAAHELGISSRQAYRDLRRGEESVAAILWLRCLVPSTEESDARWVSSVQAEMARLETRDHPIDMLPLLEHAQTAVAPMARKRKVRLLAEFPQGPVIVSADSVVARQVLVGFLSHAVQQARPGILHVTLTTAGDHSERTAGRSTVELGVWYGRDPQAASIPPVNLTVVQLVDRLGWTIKADEEEGIRYVSLLTSAHGPTVLVVDDNEGLVKLLERYLADQACRVVAAADGREGLRLAQEVMPNAIVLDVMMPEMDGWELLQRLRNHPLTADVPVIICSVIDDPGLAYSLGASLMLSKPVHRGDVVGALVKLGVV